MTIPPQYAWLDTIGTLPQMVEEALKLLGTIEAPGSANSPTIMGWAAETGLSPVYTADATAWCGLFMAVVAKRASKPVPAGPLWALNWSRFGEEAGQPSLGDVLTFTRSGGGHVALYIAEDSQAYHVLGGNQSDKVCFTRIDKKRLYRARSPIYREQPTSVKPYVVLATGKLSQDEA